MELTAPVEPGGANPAVAEEVHDAAVVVAHGAPPKVAPEADGAP